MKLRFVFLVLVALSASAIAQDKTGQLAGMTQEIAVKPAKDLGIEAPEGKNVAVLDQSWVTENPEASQAQDHHNANLELEDKGLTWPLKIKGKLFVSADTPRQPTALRITVRRQTSQGMKVFGDASVPTNGQGSWQDFEVEFPEPVVDDADAGKFFLMLSVVPLAGPIYLDGLHVTDAPGNELWEFPSFE